MIYFGLCWVFIAACGLSLAAASRGYSTWQCSGFSSLWSTGCRLEGFSNCGARAQLLHGMWDLPRPGIEPGSSCIGRQILSHWTTREIPVLSFFICLPTSIHGGFPGGSMVKNLPANAGDAGDMGSIPGSERPPGEGNGNPLQYSCLENSTDKGAWQVTVRGVAKSQTWLSMPATSVQDSLTCLSWRLFIFLGIPIATSRQIYDSVPKLQGPQDRESKWRPGRDCGTCRALSQAHKDRPSGYKALDFRREAKVLLFMQNLLFKY